MTIDEVLRKGFGLANRRFGLVFLDLLWKAIWLGVTLVLLLGVAVWFGGQARAVQSPASGIGPINRGLTAILLQQFLNAHRGQLFWALLVVFSLSGATWFLLEAAFRSRIFHDDSWKTFLATAALKTAVLASVGTILALICLGPFLTTPVGEWPQLWLETRGAATAGLAAFILVAFALTILDTLLRSDAIVLLGTDLIRVTGVIGILLSFETLIGGAFAVAVLAGFLNSSRLIHAIAMLGIAVVVVVLLNMFHSYLLLVRFSAVDIMRKNVVEI